jgi:hypothetical protein
MTSRAAGLEGHPDIQEMRARYELAAEKPAAQALDGLTLLSGLYLAASPWIVGFAGSADLAVNNLITGIAVALMATGLAAAYGRTHGMAWIVPVVGVWTIVAPWVIYGSGAPGRAIISNVIIGVLTVVLGAGAIAAARMRR